MLTSHLVLAGGGHTHALMLRRWAMNPRLRPKCMITLVNRHSTNIYSSMFPGLIAGKYKFEEILIDLRKLSSINQITFIKDEIIGLEPQNRLLKLKYREPLTFSHLSIDVGCETLLNQENSELIEKKLACSIKPFKQSIEWIEERDQESIQTCREPLTIVGSGFSALEISLALRKRWPKRKLNLKAYMSKLNSNFKSILLDSNIHLVPSNKKISGPALICSGPIVSRWLKESGLDVNDLGRVITFKTFQTLGYPNIFAVGDCGVIKESSRSPSGVWAVKAARPLANNIERALKGEELLVWKPQKNSLQLLGVNYHEKSSLAWACWGPIQIGPNSWIWKVKEFIDKRFINKFDLIGEMKIREKIKQVSCRGCAAKISATTLKKSLKKTNLFDLANHPEDAALLPESSGQARLVQSVDGFPALISDPWLNARITALHACSDIWAMGASVQSAQAIITLPEVDPALQEILLVQCLGGIKSALEPQGALLIGGHTYESRNPVIQPIGLGIDISLVVNGALANTDFILEKGRLQPGDKLLISRALGSGVIFAAAMQDQVDIKNIDSLLDTLSTNQHYRFQFQSIKNNFNEFQINACTDITGFGLIGHLSEMILSSNRKRLSSGEKILQIKLNGTSIPYFSGADKLLKNGYRSTLAPANSSALSLLDSKGKNPPLINLTFKDQKVDYQQNQFIRELLIDPQTCGPLVISCPPNSADILVNSYSWIQIGYVEEMKL